MKALLIVAHGSRNANSSRETEELTAAVRDREHPFDIVEHAYLEIAQPDIPSGVADLVARGARSITLLPLFLARGNHVERDMPETLEHLSGAFPDVVFRITPHIGTCDGLPDLVIGHLESGD
ncbi:MAG: cobalamin biosynthesis protein CbiX [Gammaproteobacteria bacterium]|nr:cobalamin biosynthesis protein CbiX [Gammaproteobacteria bacterium]MYD75931.1 cobalamin biosynthesis protein CbiX [Gammaproteobacteria bacterium]MYJ52722.1 cobalamin biosynthesis protein CbiX [Gammaproteobacteria bacterium]